MNEKSPARFIKYVNEKKITWLWELVEAASWSRARLCLHDPKDLTESKMIIGMKKESYIPPHRQRHAKKHLTVLEGELRLLYFDNSGECKDVIDLKPLDSVNPFNISNLAPQIEINNGLLHTVFSASTKSLYFETRYGGEPTEWATFSPDRENPENGLAYLKNTMANYHAN
ncbi:WbuC family cupin fold metalloprotein [Desulfobacter latus]|uniref:Cupin fold metalloprotein, WbuC family n=1 Tax=Desulfobacter latus TaxID=2292 RepID=A0A850SUC0_9BACT|nr:WbuC family cupin fold metalloprotein [Desulfobacter latus]NWH04964.1 cupin fold metalloprotein, WbuC family [Desulfobacter latus]